MGPSEMSVHPAWETKRRKRSVHSHRYGIIGVKERWWEKSTAGGRNTFSGREKKHKERRLCSA